MVLCLKRFEDEIARWKVRRPRYVLSKELKKIHMQQRGKMGSGASPEEAIPEGRRDVTRRAPAAESAHTAAASKWRRPYRAGAWLERTTCTVDRDVLPRRRRTEKRCTSSLSAGGRDAAGSVTNGEREIGRASCRERV